MSSGPKCCGRVPIGFFPVACGGVPLSETRSVRIEGLSLFEYLNDLCRVAWNSKYGQR